MKQRITNPSKSRLPSRGSLLGYLDMRARYLQREIREQEELIKVPGTTRGDLFDEAAEATELTQRIAVLEQLRREWLQVQAARQSFDEGRYGICQDCGRHISPGRLKALPYATLCVSCQTLRETRNDAV